MEEYKLRKIATILKDGHCRNVVCGEHNTITKETQDCPLLYMCGPEHYILSDIEYVTRALDWIEENDIPSQELFPYLF